MSLVDKLKRAGKILTLGGALASPLAYGPGCSPLATVVAGVLVADAIDTSSRRDIEQRRSEQSSPKIVQNIPKQSKIFTYNYYYGDLNGNHHGDPEEYEGYNKKVFYLNQEDIGVVVGLNYSKPTIIKLTLYGPQNEVLVKSENMRPAGNTAIRCLIKPYVKVGKNMFVVRIGEEIIGAVDFEVKDSSISAR